MFLYDGKWREKPHLKLLKQFDGEKKANLFKARMDAKRLNKTK